jgi:hypothetical protein
MGMNTRIGHVVRLCVEPVAVVAALSLLGCGTGEAGEGEVGVAVQALTAAAVPASNSCGYRLSTGTYGSWPGGYQARRITSVSLAEYAPVEGGYLVSEPSWLKYQTIQRGGVYRFQFVGAPQLQSTTPYIISINGVAGSSPAIQRRSAG